VPPGRCRASASAWPRSVPGRRPRLGGGAIAEVLFEEALVGGEAMSMLQRHLRLAPDLVHLDLNPWWQTVDDLGRPQPLRGRLAAAAPGPCTRAAMAPVTGIPRDLPPGGRRDPLRT